MTAPRYYAKEQSPLFRLGSKRRLALLLGVAVRDLELLAKLNRDNYRSWELGQKKRDALVGVKPKSREITQPKALLSAVQKRIAVLLGRIEKPSFVYSATKGRCYVANARQHSTSERAVKIDIKNFYPSVKRRAVRQFFVEKMQCAEDVAHLLSVLCTVDGVLPTGSSVSPVLSYFACSDLFGSLAAMADKEGLEFTVYVDDMVFSGSAATRRFTEKVVRELRRAGFVGHKIAHFRPGAVKVITGVAVWPDKIGIPHKRQQRIRKFQSAFDAETDPENLRVLGQALIGQYREAERLEAGSKLRAQPVEARLNSIGVQAMVLPRKKPNKVALRRAASSFDALRSALKKKSKAAPTVPSGATAAA